MLIIQETEYDLGSVKHGNVIEKLIPITNPTNMSITINPIGSSCSCTTGTVKKNPLPPQETTQAVIVFNSAKVGKGQLVKSYNISWVANGRHHSHGIKFKINVI